MKLINLDVKDFPKTFNWHNDQFPPLDALTYWHYLKKAKTVIEIGCGFSTRLSYESKKHLIAIDPNPRIIYPEVQYVYQEVQNVDVSIYNQLNKNDILFIDSSHIYEENSDVYYLINKVLPKLKKDVLIHFHDFFGHDGYPAKWQEIPHMKYWNENTYLLELIKQYEVISSNYELSKLYNNELKEKYQFVPDNIINNLGAVKGASLWLKKQ